MTANAVFASALALIALRSSGGTVIDSAAVSASQLPQAFAASIAASPAAIISPWSINRATRVLFDCAHALFGFRGVNSCM